MNSDWHIVPSSMTGLWAIGLALAAWLFIIWISARRKEKKSVNRPLAMAYTTTLSALAILSILLLYLGPKFPQVIKGKPLVIRTHHYQADDIDSLQSVYKELVILDYPAEGWRLWDSTTFAGINQVVVVGDGPAKDSWDRLRKSGLPVTFLPGAVPQGIVEMVYKQQINPGEEWIVKGEIIPNSHKNNKVILEGVGGILDSARVGTDGFFEFKLQPRVSGNYLFTVKALKDDGLLMDAVTIPLAIDTVRNLQIFMGTSWPHFDFNSLRNQLAERGHTVYVRNRVSRNKFQTSSINAKKAEINLLDEDFIKLIDLFIFQYSEWINLSETTHQHIKHLVAEKGIGLLLWVDQPIQRMAWPGDQITLNPTREKPDLYNTIHERGIPYRIGGKGYYPFGRG
ncbi:MAG: hypothetical protein OEX02_20530, partial [Cyclobacteriaceae bacterium]|nr:hypothetical protein [Cyclobacteriaceae bacterium]